MKNGMKCLGIQLCWLMEHYNRKERLIPDIVHSLEEIRIFDSEKGAIELVSGSKKDYCEAFGKYIDEFNDHDIWYTNWKIEFEIECGRAH